MVWKELAKTLSVYLNDHDLNLLHGLQTILQIPEESTALKVALKHLGNDHLHGEPAPGRIASELAVEVPAMVRLRAMVKECIQEVNEEPKKKQQELSDRLWQKILRSS